MIDESLITSDTYRIINDFTRSWNDALYELYSDDIRHISEHYPEIKTLSVNFGELLNYFDLDSIRKYGDEFLEAFYIATITILREQRVVYPKPYLSLIINDFEDFFETITPKDLESSYIGKIVAVEGVVRRISEIKRNIRVPIWTCLEGHIKSEIADPFKKIDRKVNCEECSTQKRKVKMELDERTSLYVNSQFIEIQDPSDLISGRRLPQRLIIYVEENLVNQVYPGDRVVFFGVIKPLIKGRTAVDSLIDVYMHALGLATVEKEFIEIEISESDEKRIRTLSKDPELVRKIIRSIAPSISGHETIKEAIALALFSGVSRILPDGTYRRGDIHILLVGDPGTGKSQLLKFIAELAPKSVYVVGKGASAAGLTAAVVRDEITGRWTVEAGALPLADGGIACIDEIEKMDSKDRTAMHSAMEQQEIVVSKAGIHATFKTRCAIIAAANPKFGKFLDDPTSPILDQIDLPPSLISRFDLIFAIRDISTDKIDETVASTILDVYKSPEAFEPIIDLELLRKYIAYARKNIKPILTDEAYEIIKNYYIELRRIGRSHRILTITPRQIEALIRLAEASARMRLDPEIKKEDAERAIRVFREAIASVMPEEEGVHDIMPIYSGGMTTKEVKKLGNIRHEILGALRNKGEMTFKEIRALIKSLSEKYKVPEDKIEDYFNKLKVEGYIVEHAPNKYRLAY